MGCRQAQSLRPVSYTHLDVYKRQPLCYGCIVTLNGVKNKSVVWPHNDENELSEILDEFVLTDDEGDE